MTTLGILKRKIQRRLASMLSLLTQSNWLSLKWGAVLHRVFDTPATALVRGRPIRVHVASFVELYRVRSYSTKEPDTLEWIDRFQPGTVFFDVGANIGVYSLYAAARHESVRVFAFEPESLNYASLNQNIALNNFQNVVRAYCLALSESASLSDLSIAKMRAGGSHNQFGDHASAPSHIQGALGLSLDDLCSRWALPFPHTLKIDVDGLELPILRGAQHILSHPHFRSLLIELRKDDPAQSEAVKAICERAGLVMVLESHRKKTADPMVIFEKK